MNRSMVSIAAWSVGSHAVKNTLPAIHEAKNLFLKGIYTRNTDVLQQQAEKYNVKAYYSFHEMLDDPDLDAVYIASPVGIHYEQAKAVLQANKHVIVEKSSFERLEQAQELIELASGKNLVLMEAFMYRFHKQFVKLIDLIKSKKFGKVRGVIATFGFPHLQAEDIRYQSELGGGSLLDAGAYTVSAINQLFFHTSTVRFSNLLSDCGFKVDTNGTAVLQGKDDIIGIASWCFGADYKNEIEVWCERATLVAKRAFSKPATYAASIEVYQNSGLYLEIQCEPMNHFAAMFEHFVGCINDQALKYYEHSILIEQMKLIASIQGALK